MLQVLFDKGMRGDNSPLVAKAVLLTGVEDQRDAKHKHILLLFYILFFVQNWINRKV